MSGAHAREVKVTGHLNEEHFAKLIHGRVNRGSHHDKKDVLDKQDRSHSVKSGKWWQIFLYGRSRLETNTIFRGIGRVSKIMIACIDVFPKDRSDYLKEKEKFKLLLQPRMRQLLKELQKEDVFAAFLDKALFDGGNADYLSVYPGKGKDPENKKHFHIFHKDEVVRTLMSDIELRNSKARNPSQTDDQKVIFYSLSRKKGIGEIELRNDSDVHYREMKLRMNGEEAIRVLQDFVKNNEEKIPGGLTLWGRAVSLFRLS